MFAVAAIEHYREACPAALAGFAFVVLWFAAFALAGFAPPERV
jgi:hypothetical protein